MKDTYLLGDPKFQEGRKRVIVSIADHFKGSDYIYIIEQLKENGDWDIIEEIEK